MKARLVVVPLVLIIALPVLSLAGGEAVSDFGFKVEPLEDVVRSQLGIEKGRGVMVSEVDDGGPADGAGLRKWDVIVKAAEFGVSRPEQLLKLAAKEKSSLNLTVVRDGKRIELTVDSPALIAEKKNPGKPVTPREKDALEKRVREICDRTGLILRGGMPGDVRRISRGECLEIMKKNLPSKEETERQNVYYRRLGFFLENTSVLDVLRLYYESVDFFFDSGRFYFVGNASMTAEAAALLVSVRSSLRGGEGDIDAGTIEGYMILRSMRYAFFEAAGVDAGGKTSGKGDIRSALLELLAEPREKDSASLPRFYKLKWKLPERAGRLFAGHLLAGGGSAADVRRLRERPPESTEQILHPEKRLVMRDSPVKITIPDFSEKLSGVFRGKKEDGRFRFCFSEAVLIRRQAAGELGTALILSQYVDPGRALEAAEGWGGDSMQVYYFQGDESRKSRAVIAWLSAWDTENDADEFFSAYAELLKAKTGSDRHVMEEYDVVGDRIHRFTVDEGGRYSRVERTGKDVTVIENVTREELSTAASWLGRAEKVEKKSTKVPQPTTDLPEFKKKK